MIQHMDFGIHKNRISEVVVTSVYSVCCEQKYQTQYVPLQILLSSFTEINWGVFCMVLWRDYK